MKQFLFLIIFAVTASCSDDGIMPSKQPIQIKGALTSDAVSKGGIDDTYYHVESNTYLANCRRGETRVIEMPDGTEVLQPTTTCDVICGYFWCGTITF